VAFLQTIEEQFKGTFDFFYLPIDFKNKCNVGYAFINMLSPQYIPPLVARFNNKRWDKFNSEKVWLRKQVLLLYALCRVL
jgi:protein phosphatase 1 regulatory subunit 42